MPRKSQSLQDMEADGLVATPQRVPVPIPEILTDERERELFAAIYKANPSRSLYSFALEPILIQYVKHVRAAEIISELIGETDRAKDVRLYLSLLRAQRDESAAMASLATKLRFAASSLSDKRRSATLDAPKPWL